MSTTNELELITVGNGVGIELPPEVLAQLGVKSGDAVSVQPMSDGIAIRPLTEFERQMRLAKQIMVKRHDLLRRLAE